MADDAGARADAAEAATSVLLSAGRTGETLALLETAAEELAGPTPTGRSKWSRSWWPQGCSTRPG